MNHSNSMRGAHRRSLADQSVGSLVQKALQLGIQLGDPLEREVLGLLTPDSLLAVIASLERKSKRNSPESSFSVRQEVEL